MPIRLMLLFVVVTPLAGIIQLENGAFGANVNLWGYTNGASWAFTAYAMFMLLGAWFSSRGRIYRATQFPVAHHSRTEIRIARGVGRLALFINLGFATLTLFSFGGLAVLTGDVGKGEFRSTLGGIGAIAYLTLKWFAPAVFALSCATYIFAGRPRCAVGPLVLTGLVTFLIGLSWGFKTSGLLIILPGFVIVLWAASSLRVSSYMLLAVVAILAAFSLFDTLEGTAYSGVLEFLLARLTVFQGDVSWYLWDQLQTGNELPAYAPTLLVAIGDQSFSALTGITRNDTERWILSHYGSLLTYTIGYPIEGIEAGHSVTGTPFSEGLIAAGYFGVPLFGLIAGLITGFVFSRIACAIRHRRPVAAALWSNYSVWCLFAWLNGGEIVQLFHISVLVGALACVILLRSIVRFVRPPPTRAPVPSLA